ncbi:MAG: polyphosphate kinase 2 family protein [Chthoniobacteraceae bacterium]
MSKTHTPFSDRYRIDHPGKFRISHTHPGDTWKFGSKEHDTKLLDEGREKLSELQQKLYAQDSWALLLIFQAMDAAGKDGTIQHVMSGVNPQGCQVYSFKAPTATELDHDYLWRCMRSLPERGRIGIFNRSYYEETLVVRVHSELLAKQKIPAKLVSKHIWSQRFEDINAFEKYLTHNGIVVCKFFLNVSKEEQKRRFLSRIEEKSKNWKFSASDALERQHWDKYMDAYEHTIRHTSTSHAPWHVIPADNKWFTRLAVAATLVETLESLHLAYPKVDAAQLKELAAAKKALLSEKKR